MSISIQDRDEYIGAIRAFLEDKDAIRLTLFKRFDQENKEYQCFDDKHMITIENGDRLAFYTFRPTHDEYKYIPEENQEERDRVLVSLHEKLMSAGLLPTFCQTAEYYPYTKEERRHSNHLTNKIIFEGHRFFQNPYVKQFDVDEGSDYAVRDFLGKRFSSSSAETKGQLSGDMLKGQVLEAFRSYLISIIADGALRTTNHLSTRVTEFKKSSEYKLLATRQNWYTNLFRFFFGKTTSQKAFDSIINDAKRIIAELETQSDTNDGEKIVAEWEAQSDTNDGERIVAEWESQSGTQHEEGITEESETQSDTNEDEGVDEESDAQLDTDDDERVDEESETPSSDTDDDKSLAAEWRRVLRQ